MDTVVYVDITREPVSWFLSMYGFKRFGSLGTPPPYNSRQVRDRTYMETLHHQPGERSYMYIQGNVVPHTR